MPRAWIPALLFVFALGFALACGDADEIADPAAPVVSPPQAPASGCADVIDASVERSADGTLVFSATVRSADTGPEKYADLWEIRDPDGAVLGTRVLLHDHVGEQPFTRRLTGVVVPDGVVRVSIAARDSVAGFCGAAFDLHLGADLGSAGDSG